MNILLKEAIEDDMPAVVEGLLAQNPRWVNRPNREGLTPLMFAVGDERPSVGCIRALIEAGANVNATIDSFTVLHWAVSDLGSCRAQLREVISLLVDAGAQLEAVDKYGFTPLMNAIIESRFSGVSALLAVGANPNAIVPSGGRTAFNQGQSVLSLSWFYHDPVDVIEALLEAGADPTLRDENGQTALEYFQGIEIEQYQKYEHRTPYAEIRLQCIERLQQSLLATESPH
ncbi:MAG: ankyrin repeat domain-containing protein [Cytophagaceae bacterium]|nr:MAG: ankyrin repeat domain-containing protein [Cytophagaceae bacterium]